MAARVQIQIEAKDAASGVLRAITSQLGGMGRAASDGADVFKAWNEVLKSKSPEEAAKANELLSISMGRLAETAVTVLIESIRDAINVTQEYAQEVRDLSLASGQSAEASSRMLQVLDDYQLTAEDAKTATRALTKEGLAPTIDTIAELSAQYNALTSVEERNAFVQKNLGRASQEWLNLLAQGPDKIRTMNDAVDSSLILTNDNIRAAEQYRLALDSWNDSVTSLKVTVGNGLLPVLTDLMTSVNNNVESGKAWKSILDLWLAGAGGFLPLAQDMRKAHEQNAKAIEQSTTTNGEYASSLEEVEARMKAEEEATKALEKATTEYYKGLISSIQDAQSELDRYNGKNTELRNKQAEINAEIEVATKRYGANSDKVKDLQGDLKDVRGELDDNAKAHQRWAAQTVFSFAQARAAADGNITEGEGKVLIEMGEQLGLFDEKTAKAMESVNESFSNLDTSDAESSINAVRRAMEALTGKTWTINVTTNTSGVSLPNPADNAGMPGYYQSGGTVYANSMSMVGEAGAEPFMPSQNGRILGHAESLHALQMAGGGNYFYGPVTIASGSEAGGDVLSMR